MAGGGEAVLVVDDDVDLVEMVKTLLEVSGYRVATALDGHEALDEAGREMPAVILLDMKMPGMDGWEFARRYRARYGRRVPIVVLTAAEDARKIAEEIEAEDYLGKPFDIDALLRVVERHVGSRA